mmetsp:Transcript_109200/g.307945  ORF Transcript_109200/g.307945 Transcript_109200/m.307945 type:complete len:405 (-) Transcript_109200:50-1264(-)
MPEVSRAGGFEPFSRLQPLIEDELQAMVCGAEEVNTPVAFWGDADAVTTGLDRVACHTVVTITSVDAKQGTFKMRMVCQWAFHSNIQMGDAEVSLRGVPGIRMPGLDVVVEESRVWKDLSGTQSPGPTSRIIFWRGTSIFLIGGFKKFNVKEFPFDRQIIDLQRLDFVWRSHKSDDDFYNTMKVGWLNIVAKSVLSEWDTRIKPAKITALQTSMDGSTCHRNCTRFQIEIHLERIADFYVRQICFVSYMITIGTCSPLAMPPTEDHMGDRLSVYGSGLLTLVAFKYGIMEHLPSVPYSTFIDNFLLYQILTVIVCTFESLFVFRFNQYEFTVDMIENCLLVMVVIVWGIYLLHVACRKPQHRVSWDDLRKGDERIRNDELGFLSEQHLPDLFTSHTRQELRMPT